PVFLVSVLGASTISVGLIEGIAEATNSIAKVFSGVISDWLGRRKPLLVLGYGLAALSKPLFPLAGDVGTVLIARFFDRSGKGIRDAPRDALLADQLPANARGSGFGLRLTLYTIGAVLGPLLAMCVMLASGGDVRAVFWIAVLPAFVSVAVLILAVKEPADGGRSSRPKLSLRGLLELPPIFWWIVAITAVLELARFSQAFLLLKAKEVGIEAAYIPTFLMLMSAVYGLTAYPFGVLADNGNRNRQLAMGAVVLMTCHGVLAAAGTVWMAALGAALWGLQMGIVQGLLAASVADASPPHLRGTAFGIYYLVDGIVSLIGSAGAGVIWALANSTLAFSVGAALAAAALLMLLISPLPRSAG
ncbi:MAG: MFS transporter, partial [Burkholderiales bacterium]